MDNTNPIQNGDNLDVDNLETDQNTVIVNSDVHAHHDNNEYLQRELKKVTQENQALLLEIEKYKQKDTLINELQNKLTESQKEVERLNNNLEKQQDNYIELQQSQKGKIDKIASRQSQHNEVILAEYKHKEEQNLAKIAEQEEIIEQLRANNAELDLQNTSLAQTKSHKMFNMKRLRTQANVHVDGAEDVDADPFGVGSDEDADGDEDGAAVILDNNGNNDNHVVEELKEEIKELKRKMSNMELDEQGGVQKLLDLAQMGQSNNDLLRELGGEDEEEYEYEEVEEEVVVEVTDDENAEIEEVNVEKLAQELEEKEKLYDEAVFQRDEYEKTMNEAIEQVVMYFV